MDQPLPLAHVFRQSDVGLVPEDRLRAAAKLCGHERQFHEGTYVEGQQRVIERVDVLEVVTWIAAVILGVDAHVVVEQTVESNVLKPDLPLSLRELRLPIGTQSFVGASRSDDHQRSTAVWTCFTGK